MLPVVAQTKFMDMVLFSLLKTSKSCITGSGLIESPQEFLGVNRSSNRNHWAPPNRNQWAPRKAQIVVNKGSRVSGSSKKQHDKRDADLHPKHQTEGPYQPDDNRDADFYLTHPCYGHDKGPSIPASTTFSSNPEIQIMNCYACIMRTPTKNKALGWPPTHISHWSLGKGSQRIPKGPVRDYYWEAPLLWALMACMTCSPSPSTLKVLSPKAP